MGGWDTSPEVMAALGAALKASATVTDLNISKNDLEAQDIAGFAEHLNDTGSLSRLDVSENCLCGVFTDRSGREEGSYDTSGLIALAKSISNLKELNISSNLLKAEGARTLAPAIEAMGSLVSLNLAENGLGVEGATHVAGVLPKW